MLDLFKRLFKSKVEVKTPSQAQFTSYTLQFFAPELNEFDDNKTIQKFSQKAFDLQSPTCQITEDKESPAVIVNLTPPSKNDNLLYHRVLPKTPTVDHYPKDTAKKIDLKKIPTIGNRQTPKLQSNTRFQRYPYLPKYRKLNDYYNLKVQALLH